MIHDFYQVLADNQAIGTTGATSEHVIDVGEVPVRKGGHPRPLWFEIVVTTTVVGGAARFLNVVIQNAATATGTYKTILSGPPIKSADLVEGTVLRIPMPMFGLDDDDDLIENGVNRALRVQWSQSGGGDVNWTAGNLHIALVGG